MRVPRTLYADMKPHLSIPPRQTTLEIERKFCCNPDSFDILRKNSGVPPFQKLLYHGRSSFNDTYYDQDGILSSKGIWVRRRNNEWQAKLRQGGNFIQSRFKEVSGRNTVRGLLEESNIKVDIDAADLGLSTIASINTLRHKWRANDIFEIVLDSTDFGHMVGEVELECVVTGDARAEVQASNEMDELIETFMQKYAWAFPPGKVVGKLSAYFAWKKNRGM